MRLAVILNLEPILVRRKFIGGTTLNLYVPGWGTTKTLSLVGLRVEGRLKRRILHAHPRPSYAAGDWKGYAKKRLHRDNSTSL